MNETASSFLFLIDLHEQDEVHEESELVWTLELGL